MAKPEMIEYLLREEVVITRHNTYAWLQDVLGNLKIGGDVARLTFMDKASLRNVQQRAQKYGRESEDFRILTQTGLDPRTKQLYLYLFKEAS